MGKTFWVRASQKANQETLHFLGFDNRKRFIVNAILVLIAIVAIKFIGGDDQMSEEWRWLLAVGVAFVIFYIPMFVWNLLKAPGRMEATFKMEAKEREVILQSERDEALRLVEQLKVPSGIDVDNLIQQLKSETLIIRHNNGLEQPYSFAQVFLAIEDQLSVGISESSFRHCILDKLDMSQKEGWHIQDDNGGVTHLITVLFRCDFVERVMEEYENKHGIVFNANTVALGPTKIKSSEAKYFITKLGSKIVQELRVQSVSQLKSELVKLLHNGKDVQSKLKRLQNSTDINEQVNAGISFEGWLAEVTIIFKNTDYEKMWYEYKIVNWEKDHHMSVYLDASVRALERLADIMKLISDKEGSPSE